MSGVRPGHIEFTQGLAIDSSSSSFNYALNLLRMDRGQTGDQRSEVLRQFLPW